MQAPAAEGAHLSRGFARGRQAEIRVRQDEPRAERLAGGALVVSGIGCLFCGIFVFSVRKQRFVWKHVTL